MQPDSIRPAASIPNIAFSDDMAQFQSKFFVVRATNLRPKRHDSIDRIIAEIANNSRA